MQETPPDASLRAWGLEFRDFTPSLTLPPRGGGRGGGVEFGFCHLKIPVTEFMPDKLVYTTCCVIKPIFFERPVYIIYYSGKSAQYPFTCKIMRRVSNPLNPPFFKSPLSPLF